MNLITNPHDTYRLGDFLLEGLESTATAFDGACAFARLSGVGYLAPAIHSFSASRPFRLTLGVDMHGTSVEALKLLVASSGPLAELFVFHNPAATFHPKTFRLEYADRWEAYVGSGNLTKGGLFENYEAGFVASLAKSAPNDMALNARFQGEFARWTDTASQLVRPLTDKLIDELAKRNLILTEAALIAQARKKGAGGSGKGRKAPLFVARAVPPAPATPSSPRPNASGGSGSGGAGGAGVGGSPPIGSPAGPNAGAMPMHFAMTVQNTDAGVGQTTPGTQKRAAEVFIPLTAVREQPAFWGWPNRFVADPSWTGKTDPQGRGKMDRRKIPFYVHGQFEWVTMTYNPGKGDYRLRNSFLRDSGNVGDILLVSRAGTVRNPIYLAEFIRPGTPKFTPASARCLTAIRPPSMKRYGYY